MIPSPVPTSPILSNPSAWLQAFADSLWLYFTQYFLLAVAFAVLVPVLYRIGWAYRRVQGHWATRRQYTLEILRSLRSILVYAVLAAVILILIKGGYIPYPSTSLGTLQIIGMTALIIIAHDAYFYWTHRLLHLPWFFRHFHSIHHTSHTPTPFTGTSMSFAESIMQASFFTVFAVLFPATLPAFPYALAIMMIVSVWGHCGMELLPTGFPSTWVGRIINSATLHDAHHKGAVGKNFGLYFQVWDRLMGTHYNPPWPPRRKS